MFKHSRTPGSNNEPILLIRVSCLSLSSFLCTSSVHAQMSFPVRHTLIVRTECFLIQDPQLFLRRHRHRPPEKRRCVAVLIGFSRDIAANLPTTRTIPPAPYLYSAISYRRLEKPSILLSSLPIPPPLAPFHLVRKHACRGYRCSPL